MKDYSRMTRAELIAELESLQVGRTPAASTSSGDSRDDQSAAAALLDSKERMRAVLETAVEGIITIDHQGLIESINPAAERIFGYSAKELAGQNVSVLMPSPYREEHDRYLTNYLRTGQAKIIGIGREVVGRRKDGTVFPMDLAVSEVRLAGRRLFTGFVRDISERKRAELRQTVQYATVAALAESNSLSEGAPKVMDALCRTLGCRFAEFWAVDRDANVIHHVQSWDPTRQENAAFEPLGAGLSNGPGSGIPGRVWETGKPEWIPVGKRDPRLLRDAALSNLGLQAAFAFPILLGAEVLGVMVFFTNDSTGLHDEILQLFGAIGNQIGQFIERKRAESKLADLARALSEKNRELEAIVYVASHDLRSPLVNIQGFSKELSRACETLRMKLSERPGAGDQREVEMLLKEDIPESIQFILAGVNRIDALLSGFLRFSRLGRAAIKIERLDIDEMLSSIVKSMDFQIKRSGATVQVDKLPSCLGDAIQTTQVFSNLLDNAIKYLDPRRPGKIVVGGCVQSGRAIYTVSDNGSGIAPEHQTKIFEIFHRLDPAGSEGEGLGLTIAQRILDRQGGRIWVESTPGQGSTFFVSLPRGIESA